MAALIHKTTLQYLPRAHTPAYEPGWDKTMGNNWEGTTWIVNPTLPECPKKYWKVDSGSVVEMNKTEKEAVDKVEADAADEATKRALIEEKKAVILEEQAIQELKDDGVLNTDGTLKK